MAVETTQGRRPDPAVQFSIFTPNRLGRLNQLIGVLAARDVHVLALTVLDATDNAIIRLIVDDPEQARSLMASHEFAFTESPILVVEMDGATELNKLMSALLEGEINVHYLYPFIPHPRGKSLLALHLEDSEIAEKLLMRHRFRVLKQADISR
jgi:hypothetical protein